jgi:hypothetical protein
MNKVVINKVLDNVLSNFKGADDGLLELSVFDLRRIIEETVEETKRGIAKRIVETRGGMIEMLTDGGFVDEEENIEEVLFEALEKL